MRGLPAQRLGDGRRGGAAHAGRRDVDHLARVRPARARPRGRARRPRRGAGRHGGAHAHESPRVPPRGRRGDAPRRGRVLGLQHLVAGADRVPAGRRGQPRARHRGRVPRSGPGRAAALPRPRARRGRRGARRAVRARKLGLRLRRRLASRLARGPGHAHLHLGNDRAAQGRAAHARQRDGAVAGHPRGHAAPRRRARGLLPARRPRRRPRHHALRRAGLRHPAHGLPRPQGGHRPPARRPADAVGRRSPDLGEAQGGARGGHGRRHPSGGRRRARRPGHAGGRAGAGPPARARSASTPRSITSSARPRRRRTFSSSSRPWG